jgi:hypothetical protein
MPIIPIVTWGMLVASHTNWTSNLLINRRGTANMDVKYRLVFCSLRSWLDFVNPSPFCYACKTFYGNSFVKFCEAMVFFCNRLKCPSLENSATMRLLKYCLAQDVLRLLLRAHRDGQVVIDEIK